MSLVLTNRSICGSRCTLKHAGKPALIDATTREIGGGKKSGKKAKERVRGWRRWRRKEIMRE